MKYTNNSDVNGIRDFEDPNVLGDGNQKICRFKQWQWQRIQSDQMLVKQVKNGWQKTWIWRLSADSALCTHGRNMWDMNKAFSGCGFIFIAWKPTWSKWQLFWHPPVWLSSCPRVSPASSVFRHIFLLRLVWSRSCLCGWLRPTVKGSGATS